MFHCSYTMSNDKQAHDLFSCNREFQQYIQQYIHFSKKIYIYTQSKKVSISAWKSFQLKLLSYCLSLQKKKKTYIFSHYTENKALYSIPSFENLVHWIQAYMCVFNIRLLLWRKEWWLYLGGFASVGGDGLLTKLCLTLHSQRL